MKCLISPSMLSSDFAKLAEESEAIIKTHGADWLHLDVMDGQFVPNLTIGAPVIKCLKKHTEAFLDCHLMVINPQNFIRPFKDAGADMFTFHLEAVPEGMAASDIIKAVKAEGMLCGISIKPKTPADALWAKEDLPTMVDMVLVMTVEPGFGGQAFMGDMMPKVELLRKKYPTLLVEVDGGLDKNTIKPAAEAGANVIVAGSSIFKSEDRTAAVSALREACEKSAALQPISNEEVLKRTARGK